MMLNDKTCPLCSAAQLDPFHTDPTRPYVQCGRCALVFVNTCDLPSIAAERAQYDLHNNDPSDKAYQQFLKRLLVPMQALLPNNAQGLDFGCGPGPTVSVILNARGYHVENYDPYYFPDDTLLNKAVDFISCTEVIEHIHQPMPLLDQLWHNIRPNGMFGFMTKRLIDQTSFARWHYKNDPTHVRFYSDTSFRWLASRWQARLILPCDDVAIFIKNARAKG